MKEQEPGDEQERKSRKSAARIKQLVERAMRDPSYRAQLFEVAASALSAGRDTSGARSCTICGHPVLDHKAGAACKCCGRGVVSISFGGPFK